MALHLRPRDARCYSVLFDEFRKFHLRRTPTNRHPFCAKEPSHCGRDDSSLRCAIYPCADAADELSANGAGGDGRRNEGC
jgi:hypothetical protein